MASSQCTWTCQSTNNWLNKTHQTMVSSHPQLMRTPTSVAQMATMSSPSSTAAARMTPTVTKDHATSIKAPVLLSSHSETWHGLMMPILQILHQSSVDPMASTIGMIPMTDFKLQEEVSLTNTMKSNATPNGDKTAPPEHLLLNSLTMMAHTFSLPPNGTTGVLKTSSMSPAGTMELSTQLMWHG